MPLCFYVIRSFLPSLPGERSAVTQIPAESNDRRLSKSIAVELRRTLPHTAARPSLNMCDGVTHEVDYTRQGTARRQAPGRDVTVLSS